MDPADQIRSSSASTAEGRGAYRSTEDGGAGLGLSIVNVIVEAQSEGG